MALKMSKAMIDKKKGQWIGTQGWKTYCKFFREGYDCGIAVANANYWL